MNMLTAATTAEKGFFKELFENYPCETANSILAVVLIIIGTVIFKMIRNPLWRSAMKDVFRRRIVVISFAVLCIYAMIAILDSIRLYRPMREGQGTVLTDNSENPVMNRRECSALDLILTNVKYPVEMSYSAPLQDTTFVAMTVTDETGQALSDEHGRVRREQLPLESPGKHLLGTDKVGNDCLYLGMKGIRTGIIIGALTTLMVVPFALLLGITSGYFGGRIDDAVQFIITVLSSIPSILLIMAFMLVFGQGLFQLCLALGIGSWTGLCRLIRAESMKIREMDYIQSCEAMGVSKLTIMIRHIMPNVMHLVLITAVLGFSGRVMSEAVLTYIGVGVGSGTVSWGSMVNDAIAELSREPVIWWKLTTAFGFMFALVLPANIFGDAIRDALDPKLRTQ